MKKALLILCSIAVTIILMSGCRYERNYYHSKNGRIRHVRAARYPVWFNVREKGYSKRTRRIMRNWDRTQH